MIKPICVPAPDTFVRLWLHESQRCFHDRLINNDDKLWFTQR